MPSTKVIPFAESPEPGAEPAAQGDAAEALSQVVALKTKLEEAAAECGRWESSLATQQQLEQLLRQGRGHLQEMRGRLEQVTMDRDRLAAELRDGSAAHQRELGDLQTQLDGLSEQLQKAAAERGRLASQLGEQEAAHQRYVEERTDDRIKFERLLAEATSNQRQMVEELNEQRQQIDTMREAAMRAQSLAREIMRAHETLKSKTTDPVE